jgi:hypothetical protein
MLPQHGGVPNFSLRIPGPIKALLVIVLVCGLMLTLSFHLNTEPGDIAAQNRTKLSLIITLILSALLFLAGTGRWWHPHLWRNGNSQRHHRHRTGRRRKHSHTHSHRKRS